MHTQPTSIMAAQWRWAGHMIREKKEKWTTLITEQQPRESKRNRDRQIKRWEDAIRKISGPIWIHIAKDRIEYIIISSAIKAILFLYSVF